MNANTVKALVLDAYYQVVDNKIFRLLLVLEALIVGCFFLIGFEKDEVRVLFGLWTFSYTSIFAAVGQHFSANTDLQGIAIQRLQSVVVEGLSGSLGMIVCLSATSFFLPRLLEKGAADIVFSKPVSRLALMLSRYVSGLIFVGLLALLGVTGVWIGLLVSSGYNDPGVLWGAFTLVYLFAILHAISIWVGVLTRSTVAAMLISIVFFMGNGCVQSIWVARTYFKEAGLAAERQGENEDTSDVVETREEPTGFVHVMLVTLDTLHLVLPKTMDADVLTQKLRKSVTAESWKLTDPVAKVTIPHPPEGLALVSPSDGATNVDLAAAPVVFESPDQRSRIEITRRAREVERVDPSGKTPPRKRRLSTQQAADDVVTRVRAAAKVVGEVKTDRTELDQRYAIVVSWREGDAGHRVYVVAFGDHVLELALTADGLGPPGNGHAVTLGGNAPQFGEFVNSVRIAREAEVPGPEEWYAQRLRWSGPLSSNIGFSVGSSLLFAALMLALAWAKLRKIDF